MNRGRARNTGASSGFRGRSPNRGGPPRHSPVGADRAFANDTFGRGDDMSRARGNNSNLTSRGSGSKHSNYNPTSGYMYRPKKPVPDGEGGFSDTQKLEQVQHHSEPSERFVASDIVHNTVLPSLSTHSSSTAIHMDVSTVQIGQIGISAPMASISGIGNIGQNQMNLSQANISNQISQQLRSGQITAAHATIAKLRLAQSRGMLGSPQSGIAGMSGARMHPGSAGLSMLSQTLNRANMNQMQRTALRFGRGDDMSLGRGNNSNLTSRGSGSKHSNYNPTSGYMYRPKKPVPDREGGFSDTQKLEQVQHRSEPSERFVASDIVHNTVLPSLSTHSSSTEIHMDVSTVQIGQIGQTRIEGAEDSATLRIDLSRKLNIGCHMDVSQLPSASGNEDRPSQEKGPETIEGIKDSGHSENVAEIKPFDICPKTGTMVMLKPSLLQMNKEKRRSKEEQSEIILRSGMVLMRNYLSISDQAKIVKACRNLGLGHGGFYQPGYHDGAKLHLKMMCLGKNWDPETGNYGDVRSIDGAKPPIIPREFHQLVEKAIKDSHALIERNSKRSNVEDILPRMSPNLCIVNYYSASGSLGLHQDKDESRESIKNGLPVVSFSLGDSAEFLYGDQRDVDKAEKVELKSGDVLIFGGKSRNIFHGVTQILAKTAPKALLEETNLLPGRLNLTFREY